MSDSLQIHGLQHTRLPCPSLSSGVCANSCPLSQGCCVTISSSVSLFCFCLQSFPASRAFLISQLFASGCQGTGASDLSGAQVSIQESTKSYHFRTKDTVFPVIQEIPWVLGAMCLEPESKTKYWQELGTDQYLYFLLLYNDPSSLPHIHSHSLSPFPLYVLFLPFLSFFLSFFLYYNSDTKFLKLSYTL